MYIYLLQCRKLYFVIIRNYLSLEVTPEKKIYFELLLTSPTTQMVGVSPSTPRSQQFHASEGNMHVYSFLLASFSVCLHVELAHGCRAFICMHLFYWHVCPACVCVSLCVYVYVRVSTAVWRHWVSVKA